MSSHADHNEGMRVLEEFVCQAIPDPSVLADSSRPAPPGTEHQLDLLVTDPASLSATLLGEDGQLRDRITIGGGVGLSLLFASLPTPARGDKAALAFVINVPAGMPTHGVAQILQQWAIRHGILRIRANGVEVPVSATATETVPVIVEALEQKATGVHPDEPR